MSISILKQHPQLWLVLQIDLWEVISKFKALKNIDYNTFFKMYLSYVVPINDNG